MLPVASLVTKYVDCEEQDAHDDTNPSSQPEPLSPAITEKKEKPPIKSLEAESKPKAQGSKRASTELAESKPKKRRKKSELDTDTSPSEVKQSVTKKPGPREERDPTLSPEFDVENEDEAQNLVEDHNVDTKKIDASESEMSVVLDEDPKIAKNRRRKSDSKPKGRKADSTKTKQTSEPHADPDTEEIRRLQGWLVKCGIRKMWYKELAPYGAPKGKIKHLKEMLADAGMTGRYSKEKADQVREERELKADLEAVQQGEKAWGKAEDEDEEAKVEGDGRPRRRLARGLQGLDFLNDDDGEETD